MVSPSPSAANAATFLSSVGVVVPGAQFEASAVMACTEHEDVSVAESDSPGAFHLHQLLAGHEFSRLEPWDVPVSCHIDQHTATDDAVAVVVDGVDGRFAGGDGTDRFAL